MAVIGNRHGPMHVRFANHHELCRTVRGPARGGEQLDAPFLLAIVGDEFGFASMAPGVAERHGFSSARIHTIAEAGAGLGVDHGGDKPAAARSLE